MVTCILWVWFGRWWFSEAKWLCHFPLELVTKMPDK